LRAQLPLSGFTILYKPGASFNTKPFQHAVSEVKILMTCVASLEARLEVTRTERRIE
jgi:hypothetical protein